jgi:hypothetical protein
MEYVLYNLIFPSNDAYKFIFTMYIYATVATTAANTQPLCYIHGKNEYVYNIT